MEVTTVGIDLAKNVFQVHAVSRSGEVIVRRALRRAQVIPFFAKLPSCLIGMEACGTSHHWARELVALGHEVRLMQPAYVKPYVKRGKTDVATRRRSARRSPVLPCASCRSSRLSSRQRWRCTGRAISSFGSARSSST